MIALVLRWTPRRHRREIGRQIGRSYLAVGIPIFVDVHAGPSAGLRKNSDIGIPRHAAVGFAAAASAALDRRCADREATLIKNLLVAASVDFSGSPRADAGYVGVLQIRIDIEASRAFAGWPKPAVINLVLKKMPLSAVIESDGFFL